MGKFKGIWNYILPTPSIKEYELSWDEGTNTYWWYKNDKEKKMGFKTWTSVKISSWLHKWFGWYV